jgi:FlaA1/EpsC-like NDP-sugar epimerase
LTIALTVQVALGLLSTAGFIPRLSILLMDFVLSLVLLIGIRTGLRLIRERYARKRPSSAAPAWRVAIVGTSELATRLALELRATGNEPREVVAFFDDDPRMWNKSPHGIPVVGMPECLLNEEWSRKLDEVIVVLPPDASVRVRQIGEMLKTAPVKVSAVSTWPILQPLVA